MTLTHVNLLLIPLNAYFVGSDTSYLSKIVNGVAVVFNIAIVSVKLAGY